MAVLVLPSPLQSALEQASSGFSPNLGDAGGAVRATAAALTAADITDIFFFVISEQVVGNV